MRVIHGGGAVGSEVWIGGTEYVGRSVDGGMRFERVATSGLDALGEVRGILRDADGVVWICGEAGARYLATSKDGRNLARVPSAAKTEPGRLVATPTGVLVLGDGLWLGRRGAVQRLGGPRGLTDACATTTGALVAVDGRGGIHRSGDGGRSWSKAGRPRGPTDTILSLAVLEEAIVVFGHMGELLVSGDDGRSFTGGTAPEGFQPTCAVGHRGVAWAGGEDAIVAVRVSR